MPTSSGARGEKIAAKKRYRFGSGSEKRGLGLNRSAPRSNNHTKPDIKKGSMELPGKLNATEVKNHMDARGR